MSERKWFEIRKKGDLLNSRNTKLADLGNSVEGPKIKISTLKGVGFGLFADRNYHKHEIITIYGGKLHYEKVKGDYVFRLSEKIPLYVDGEIDFHPTEKGRWLNHGYDTEYPEAHKPFAGALDRNKPNANTEFYIAKKKGFPICYIRALRNILKGEELFVDYGPLYW